jgi:NitT/TauT family transport system permease protein
MLEFLRFSRRRSVFRDAEPRSSTVAPILACLIVIGAWELLARLSQMPPYLLPAPSAVIVELFRERQLLAMHAWVTLAEAVLGLIAACIIGVALAVVIVLFRSLGDAIYPLIVISQVIPKVALAPLMIIYVGFGIQSKILMVFLLAFFPIVVNTIMGLRSISSDLLQLLATMKASRWQVMWRIRMPNAIPQMVEGTKIAVTLAVTGALVGEFASGNEGLGYLILASSANLNTLLSFAAILVLAVLGIVLFECVKMLGNAVTPKPLRSQS